MTLFTHYVYNRQGRCLKGLVLAEDATAEEVIRAYLDATDGIRVTSVRVEDGAAWFNELSRRDGKEYVRYAIPSGAVSSRGFPDVPEEEECTCRETENYYNEYGQHVTTVVLDENCPQHGLSSEEQLVPGASRPELGLPPPQCRPEGDQVTLFTHYIYNSQGQCLLGLEISPDASPEEAAQAYVDLSGGTRTSPVLLENGYAFFAEQNRGDGQEHARYIKQAESSAVVRDWEEEELMKALFDTMVKRDLQTATPVEPDANAGTFTVIHRGSAGRNPVIEHSHDGETSSWTRQPYYGWTTLDGWPAVPDFAARLDEELESGL